MPYNFVADGFHIKKLCNNFLRNRPKCNFRRKPVVLRFLSPSGGLGATYAVHHRLIGKHVVNILLLLTELFR